MQKFVGKGCVFGALLVLSACQTNTQAPVFTTQPSKSFFHSFSPNMSQAQTVQDALISSGDPKLAQVRVEANQNGVVLSGYVKKIRQSDAAELIAGRIVGPQNVQNNIIVRQ